MRVMMVNEIEILRTFSDDKNNELKIELWKCFLRYNDETMEILGEVTFGGDWTEILYDSSAKPF